MTIREHPPLYTVLPDGRWDFYIDNSSLKDFRMCERYFEHRHIRQIVPRGKNAIVMGIGSWWSETLENIYLTIQNKGTIGQLECLEIAARAWASTKMDEYAIAEPKKFASFGGREGAIVMISQYYETYIQHDNRNWKIIAAESGFGLKGECLVGENTKVVVHWIGKPDLTVLEGHRLCPLDHKTVTRIDGDINGKYKPHPQTAGYIFATELIARSLGLDITVDRCIINVGARTEPSDKPRNGGPKRPRFVRVVVGYTKDEIVEWQGQTLAKVTRLREAIETNTFLWNENQCSNMFFRPCPYRGIDSNTPKAREAIIAGNFDKGQRWVPYQIEEEEE